MPRVWRRYGYGWVTAGFFLVSLAGHWLFGWFANVGEQHAHDQPVELSAYAVEMTRRRLCQRRAGRIDPALAQ
jgi:hypothetical protein